ncbi:MAG: RsmE family RNA methyltransferase, partial [Clostridia bacterium]|nr:RsmE family RNA methyltransferase [Clostridia bacterium]
LIGPEGGIAPEEANEAASQGAKLVTLGPRILRAETAAIAAAAAVMAVWGDL